MNAGDILTASQADYVVQLEQLRDLVEEIVGRFPGWLPVIDRKLKTSEAARYTAMLGWDGPRPMEYSYLEYDEKLFPHKRVSGTERWGQPLEQFGQSDWFPVDMESHTYVANIRSMGVVITPEKVREMTGSQTAA